MNYYALATTDIPGACKQLLSAIAASHSQGHWLALLDTAFDDGSRALRGSPENWPIYHQGKYASFKTISPILVSLSAGNDALLRQQISSLLRHASGRPMLSFIHSLVAPQTLRDSWQNILEIETADGESFLLRFADTRTLPAIAGALHEHAWPRLCKNVEQWFVIDRDGRLQALPVATKDQEASTTLLTLIRIDDKALAELLRLGQADALASALNEQFRDLLPRANGALAYRWLNDVSELADRNGLDAFPDQLALAVAACSTEGALLSNEDFAVWLCQGSWANGTFSDALSDFVGRHFDA